MADDRLHQLDLPETATDALPAPMASYFRACESHLGFVPNVLRSYSFDPDKLQHFVDFYQDVMLADSELSKLEREMVAVVVSSRNHCYYCLTAHGAAVRELSGNPALGEQLVMNHRAARGLTDRQRVMLEFAEKLADAPDAIEDEDRNALREAGFSDRGIWDLASVAAFFSMTNRLAAAVDMQPNSEYHAQAR